MFLIAILAALVVSAVAREYAFDPRMWGESGVLVSDHAEGQYCPSVESVGDFTVTTWQDDRGADPDIALAVVADNGTVVRERVFARSGVQTRPYVAGRWLVFVESVNGADWSISALRLANLDAASDSLVVITDAPGAKPEVAADVTQDGDLLVAWIADTPKGDRVLRGAVLGQGQRSPVRFPIVNTIGAVMDLHMAVNANLVFFAWTDWSGAEPHVTAQCLDLTERARAFGPNGLVLSPTRSWTWNPRIVPSEQGYGAFTWIERQETGASRVVFQIVDYQTNFRFAHALPATNWSLDMTETDTAPLFGGGVVVASAEAQSDGDALSATAIDFAGARRWSTVVSDLGQPIRDVKAVSNSLASWITWRDERFGNADIFAARLTPTGEPTWLDNGSCVARAQGGQWKPVPQNTQEGNLIVSWIDERQAETPRIGLQKMR